MASKLPGEFVLGESRLGGSSTPTISSEVTLTDRLSWARIHTDWLPWRYEVVTGPVAVVLSVYAAWIRSNQPDLAAFFDSAEWWDVAIPAAIGLAVAAVVTPLVAFLGKLIRAPSRILAERLVEANTMIQEIDRERTTLRVEVASLRDTKPRISHELRRVEGMEGWHFGVVVIRNDGAGARFQATYTLHGPLWETNADVLGFSRTQVFVCEWFSHPLPEEYRPTRPQHLSLQIDRGDEGEIFLASFVPETGEMPSGRRKVRLSAVRQDVRVQPFAASADPVEQPWCELTLKVTSDREMAGVGSWSRRLRITVDDIVDLG
jgi:hypothetical protein